MISAPAEFWLINASQQLLLYFGDYAASPLFFFFKTAFAARAIIILKKGKNKNQNFSTAL
jgi:hypothetical protein